jgi:hypothetical protein
MTQPLLPLRTHIFEEIFDGDRLLNLLDYLVTALLLLFAGAIGLTLVFPG